MCSDNHHNDGHIAVVLPAAIGVQAALIEANPKKFYKPPYVGGAGLLSFVPLPAAEIIFIWLLLRSKSGTGAREQETADITQLKKATKELYEPQEVLLTEPVVSVTEETTRTLEPVYRKRKDE